MAEFGFDGVLDKQPQTHPTLSAAMRFDFLEPRKAILTPEHLKQFQDSNAHRELLEYIQSLNDAVIGVKLPHQSDEPESPVSEIYTSSVVAHFGYRASEQRSVYLRRSNKWRKRPRPLITKHRVSATPPLKLFTTRSMTCVATPIPLSLC